MVIDPGDTTFPRKPDCVDKATFMEENDTNIDMKAVEDAGGIRSTLNRVRL